MRKWQVIPWMCDSPGVTSADTHHSAGSLLGGDKKRLERTIPNRKLNTWIWCPRRKTRPKMMAAAFWLWSTRQMTMTHERSNRRASPSPYFSTPPTPGSRVVCVCSQETSWDKPWARTCAWSSTSPQETRQCHPRPLIQGLCLFSRLRFYRSRRSGPSRSLLLVRKLSSKRSTRFVSEAMGDGRGDREGLREHQLVESDT